MKRNPYRKIQVNQKFVPEKKQEVKKNPAERGKTRKRPKRKGKKNKF